MIIPLDKLLTYNKNKYIFSRAIMEAVEKIGNMKSFPEDDTRWKVVPNIMKLMLNNDIKFIHNEEAEKEQ